MSQPHQGVWRNYLRNGAALYLVEGEANWNAPVVETAGVRKKVSKHSDRLIGITIIDQESRLFTRRL